MIHTIYETRLSELMFHVRRREPVVGIWGWRFRLWWAWLAWEQTRVVHVEHLGVAGLGFLCATRAGICFQLVVIEFWVSVLICRCCQADLRLLRLLLPTTRTKRTCICLPRFNTRRILAVLQNSSLLLGCVIGGCGKQRTLSKLVGWRPDLRGLEANKS